MHLKPPQSLMDPEIQFRGCLCKLVNTIKKFLRDDDDGEMFLVVASNSIKDQGLCVILYKKLKFFIQIKLELKNKTHPN